MLINQIWIAKPLHKFLPLLLFLSLCWNQCWKSSAWSVSALNTMQLPEQTRHNRRPNYLHKKVNIQMSRLGHHPSAYKSTYSSYYSYPKGLPIQANGTSSRRKSSPDDLSYGVTPVGGFGLASPGNNFISLGALSQSIKKGTNYVWSRGNDLKADHEQARRGKEKEKASTNLKVDGREEKVRRNGGNDQWSQPDRSKKYDKLDMWIMGKPVSPIAMTYLHPDVSQYKARQLRKLMAGNLDREWTSEAPPRILRQRGISGAMGSTASGDFGHLDSKLLKEVLNLNFTFRHTLGAPYTLPEPQLQVFRNWLVEKATCEMDLIWEELSSRFWPRWIRRGVCLNHPGQSCSWPPGMKCRPSGSRALELLYWNCEDAVRSQTRKRAAEQRSLRRIAANKFHSGFYDMEPVKESDESDSTPRSVPRLSLRDTLRLNPGNSTASSYQTNHNSMPYVRLTQFHRSTRQTADNHNNNINHKNKAKYANKRRREISKGPLSKEEKRKRRAKRLIKRLSKTANGYHCFWQFQKYVISDRCSCLCS